MRRRYIDERRVRSAKMLDDQPGLIDRHRAQIGAVALEQQGGASVAGVFDGDFLARPNQKTAYQIQPVLRARSDDDPLRWRAHAARCPEMRRHGLPQFVAAARRAVFRQVAAGTREIFVDQAPPGVERKITTVETA